MAIADCIFGEWVSSIGRCVLTVAGKVDKTGAPIQTYDRHTKRIRSVAIGPNGEWFASGGQDNLIHLWHIKTGEILTTFLGHAEQVLSVKFSPDNCSLISGSADETIKIWNIQTGLHQTLKAERLYEGMNIAGIKGLSEEAIATLIRLGAKSDDRSVRMP